MLDPSHRSLLLDLLRPPIGYRLDRAVGTTYSLSLYALLTAPLAFAQFDAELDEGQDPDLVALLEATRRHADHISIFCQAGKISVPSSYQPIFANLEQSVHEVTAPLGGVFHPKVWILRFFAPDGLPAHYRLLVLSRNLTFDRSWDTVVRLDGERAAGREGRAAARQINRPLSEFIALLPDLAIRGLPPEEVEAIRNFAGELLAVEFAPPDGFSGVKFWPLGVRKRQQTLVDDAHRSGLIISPFLTDGLLNRIKSDGGEHVLISRAEALDRIDPSTLVPFGQQVFVFDPSLSSPEEAADEEELTGLHAKVFVFDQGSKSRILTGSANATGPAFGQNVEFLVELEGPKCRVGVKKILGEEDDDKSSPSLMNLLVSYHRSDGEPMPESLEEQLKFDADILRARIASVPMNVNVSELADADEFSLHISSDQPLLDTKEDVQLTCRPITLGSRLAHRVDPSQKLNLAVPKVSFAALSSFLVFELTLRRKRKIAKAPFVVNADLIGTPEDRQQRVLSSLLDSKTKVLRYLLFLLADGHQGGGAFGFSRPIEGRESDRSTAGVLFDGLPLLEAMLQMLAQEPSRLDPIERLIEDLSSTDKGCALLPDKIDEVWRPIWAARRGIEQ